MKHSAHPVRWLVPLAALALVGGGIDEGLAADALRTVVEQDF